MGFFRKFRLPEWEISTREMAVCSSVVVAAVLSMAATPAHAVPSFARQTGLPCTACHTAYPQLNAYGRRFKLNSYSFDGGDSKMPPIAFMLQPSFTHTNKDQVADAAPHFGKNNNFALSQASIFYGGKIYGKLGAFSQLTYSGVDDRLSLDNTDIRWSGSGKLGGSVKCAPLSRPSCGLFKINFIS